MWKLNDTPHSMKTWCELAASYIRFPPDRPPVEQELMEHLQDKVDDFMEHGMPRVDAEQKAVQEMGEPRETGLLLRQIHKPYLGWVWRGTQVLLAVLLLVTAVNLIGWLRFLNVETNPKFGMEDGVYELEAKEGADGYHSRRTLYAEPNCSARLDGYTFTVTRVARWEHYYTAESGISDYTRLHFLIEVTNPRPWLVETVLPRWFYAVDSLGNYYYSAHEYNNTKEPSFGGNGVRTGLFTETWDMWSNNYVSGQAQWIELRYDRDGQEVALRIDLTGGEGT